MLSCYHATRLLSDRLEQPLSRRQRIGLAIHLTVCSACRSFGKQVEFLRRAAARFVEAADLENSRRSLGASSPRLHAAAPPADPPTRGESE